MKEARETMERILTTEEENDLMAGLWFVRCFVDLMDAAAAGPECLSEIDKNGLLEMTLEAKGRMKRVMEIVDGIR